MTDNGFLSVVLLVVANSYRWACASTPTCFDDEWHEVRLVAVGLALLVVVDSCCLARDCVDVLADEAL
jgi:hypothetical protein